LKNWKRLFGNSHRCYQSCWQHEHGRGHSPSKLQYDEAYCVLDARSFQHRRKNWQDLTKDKLTASTFGLAIGFGLWPKRRVQLWLEKIGVKEPFSRHLAICWNNMNEEKALERYKLITRNEVDPPVFKVHGERNPDDDWLAASPDGEVKKDNLYDLPSGGVLEIKCPFFADEKIMSNPRGSCIEIENTGMIKRR